MYWNYKSNFSIWFQSTKHNIKRHSNSSFIHHSVSGTKRTDISKTQTKLVFVLFLPPLVKYIMYTCAWLIHAYFYTRLKYTHGKMSMEWRKGRVPTPPWRLLESRKTGLCKPRTGETTGFTHPNSRLSWLGCVHHSALMQPLLSSRHFWQYQS